ncbi:putative glycoside hydrolase [Galbibacter pacificus]|uniref:DUF4015 domain-containing protein n=1 Tax=Galbibacter pacificus TaxID=2996052 RepID=A0ABT6FT58_9FLAO|nr:putative glycoside hydrolase [Galbibacter pacificus]MDG3582424.1 putative glycoside hydrolase [Galbibacter pacificus]MDG3586458.1 hypothetical protein [Galbibacter pacificus]
MKLFKLFLILVTICFFSCVEKQKSDAEDTAENKIDKTKGQDFKYWTWITANQEREDTSYQKEFAKYKVNGIDAVLINTNTDPKLLERLTPIAKKEGLEVHAWIMAMNRPGDTVALKHPDWYTVNKEGKSCFDTRPYVDYYQWLCPTRKASREHVLSLVEGLSKVEGVETVHLDYIRFSDIFLPIGLLPKYNLKQEVELPEFDFCYCDVCVAEFERTYHKNPRDFDNPAIDMEWKQFRLNKIKAVVDEAYEIAHKHGKRLSAAVFPYPEMADHMVRQRWDKWNIDMVLPMIYNNFYNEGIDWIGFATKQGVADLEGKNTELHTGVFVPPMSGEDLRQAINLAKTNGAKGISFFDGNALTDEHLQVIKESK